MANLIYWMTLHTELEVVDRWRHSYDVFPDSNRTQPFGSGATLSYNYIDLQIKNNTRQDFVLHIAFTQDSLQGQWRSESPSRYSFQVYQKAHWITHEPWVGYLRHNTIYRKVIDKETQETQDEFLTENHAIMMYQPFLEA